MVDETRRVVAKSISQDGPCHGAWTRTCLILACVDIVQKILQQKTPFLYTQRENAPVFDAKQEYMLKAGHNIVSTSAE
jgi:hypothetical protein